MEAVAAVAVASVAVVGDSVAWVDWPCTLPLLGHIKVGCPGRCTVWDCLDSPTCEIA